VHQPTFITKATVNEQEFTGTGNSKAKAKQDFAAKVLSTVIQTDPDRNGIDIYAATTAGSDTNLLEWRTPTGDLFALEPTTRIKLAQQIALAQDFGDLAGTPSMPGRDHPLYAPPGFRSPNQSPFIRSTPPMAPTVRTNSENHNNMVGHVRPMSPPQAVAKKFSQMFVNRPPIDFEKAKSYPVMVLVELFPEMKIEWVDGVGRGDRQFRVESEIHGRRFFGEGRSKKIAKLNLAKTVLLCMYDIHDFKDTDTSPKPAKTKIEGNEVSFEKKFPLTQLKELVGEDVQYDIVQVTGDENSDENEKMYNCTVIIKGVPYEAIGKNRNLAKLRCAKRALEVLKPKKEGGKLMIIDNEPGSPGEKKEIDTSRHPSMVFHELFRDVRISESETKATNGLPEYHMEAEIEGKTFQAKANAKKKAKLRLVLAALEQLRDIPNETWENVDLKDVYEDKQPSNNPATNHPIVLLLKLNPNTRFSVTEDYECDAAEKYKAIAYVGDKEFHGQGPNKKAAKTMAARLSLTSLYGIHPDTYVEESHGLLREPGAPL
jgi:dsRNA-specific ribonuclease